MKKLIIIILFISGVSFGQETLRLFVDGEVINYSVPIFSSSNKLQPSAMYITDSNLVNPYKMLTNEIYGLDDDGVDVEGVILISNSLRVPGTITTYGGATGIEWIELIGDSGYVYWSAMHSGGAGDMQQPAWDSTNQAWTFVDNGSGGGTDDQTISDFSLTGNTISLEIEDDGVAAQTVDISGATAVSANTTHLSSNGTDHTYIDQDVSTTASPSFADVSIGSFAVIDSTDSSYIQINQQTDGVGMRINGFDNQNAEWGSMSINQYGQFQLNASKVIVYGTNSLYADNVQAYFGNSYDFRLLFNGSTFVLTDGVNNFLTVTDAGSDADFNFKGRIEHDGVKINTHTIVGDTTLTASMMYGGIFYCTTGDTITLPAVTSGMSITVITIGAIEVSVNPNGSDKLWLDGTALDDGDKATNLSTAGDIAVVTYYSADGWYVSSNSWTDGS